VESSTMTTVASARNLGGRHRQSAHNVGQQSQSRRVGLTDISTAQTDDEVFAR